MNTARPYDTFTAHGGADRDWQLNAACRSENPTPENIRERAELFYPHRSQGRGSEKAMNQAAAAAKAICHTCPVTQACETYRDKLDIHYGIWAGRTEPDRERDHQRGGAA